MDRNQTPNNFGVRAEFGAQSYALSCTFSFGYFMTGLNTKIYSKVLLVSLSLMIRDYKEVTISASQVFLEQHLLSLPVMNILGCY